MLKISNTTPEAEESFSITGLTLQNMKDLRDALGETTGVSSYGLFEGLRDFLHELGEGS